EDDAYLMIVNAANPVKSIADLRSSGKPLYLGGTREGSTNVIFAVIARDMLALNVGVTRGYPGASEIWLAMERGEVDGQIMDISPTAVGPPRLWGEATLRRWRPSGGPGRHPIFAVFPLRGGLFTGGVDRPLTNSAGLPFFRGLPFVPPPAIPADRAAILERA